MNAPDLSPGELLRAMAVGDPGSDDRAVPGGHRLLPGAGRYGMRTPASSVALGRAAAAAAVACGVALGAAVGGRAEKTGEITRNSPAAKGPRGSMGIQGDSSMRSRMFGPASTLGAATAATVTIGALAGNAVQWRVEDGGNGHWYQVRSSGPITWTSAKSDAEALGGHLATPTTGAEKSFVTTVVLAIPGFGESAVYRWGPWLGGFQDRSSPTYSEPAGGWRWVTGEPWGYSAWRIDEPNNLCSQNQQQEDFLSVSGNGVQSNGAWNDLPPDGCGNDPVVSYVIEWEADCNGDGVIDYGQCRNGSLPDYDGNNVPDCCESTIPCVVGNYPVQWRVEDGGNGHWYGLTEPGSNWHACAASAIARGGHLATLTSAAETAFAAAAAGSENVSYIGARQDDGAAEPFGGWRWITGEPWGYQPWHFNMDDAPCGASSGPGEQQYLWMHNAVRQWDDVNDIDFPGCPLVAKRGIIEWSADCNNDGIVDKGQILRGQLADSNGDGVPDVCQNPTCHDADLYANGVVNGADLAILLSEWGPVSPNTTSDINRDGQVNGADLALLLSFWGPCS